MGASQAAIDFGDMDLPLFSGTPMAVPHTEDAQGSSVQGRGQLSFFACTFCKDGGRIAGRYCFCAAGTTARLEDRQKGKR